MDIEAQHLEEGNEIVVSLDRNDYGIVENVQTCWSGVLRPAPLAPRGVEAQTRTTITLIDGRTFTVNAHYKVMVLS